MKETKWFNNTAEMRAHVRAEQAEGAFLYEPKELVEPKTTPAESEGRQTKPAKQKGKGE